MMVRTTDNGILRRHVEDVRRQLMDGEGLSGADGDAPAATRRCSSRWWPSARRRARSTPTSRSRPSSTRKEVDEKVDALTAMMTPALTIVMGVARRVHRALADHADVPAHRPRQRRGRRGGAPEMSARLRSERGFALVEALIAVAILGMTLVVFIAGLSTGLAGDRRRPTASRRRTSSRARRWSTRRTTPYSAAPHTYADRDAAERLRRHIDRAATISGGDANVELITVQVTQGRQRRLHARRLQGEPMRTRRGERGLGLVELLDRPRDHGLDPERARA